jgi:hypothetical protein
VRRASMGMAAARLGEGPVVREKRDERIWFQRAVIAMEIMGNDGLGNLVRPVECAWMGDGCGARSIAAEKMGLGADGEMERG